MIAEVAGDCPELGSVVYIGEDSWARAGRRDDARTGTGRDRGGGSPFDDPINIQYTSGTTGFPKGATLTTTTSPTTATFLGEMMGYDNTDRICVPVPFYHCFAW